MSTAKPGEAGEAGRLSRRDRAAMALALECLRAHSSYPGNAASALLDADEALGVSWPDFSPAAFAMLRALRSSHARTPTARRLLRARLALALRVLLRVDAGDGHQWGGTHEHWAELPRSGACMNPEANGWTWAPYQGWRRPLRVHPLWLDAPPHAAATGDRRDDSAARAAGGGDV